MSQIDVLCQGCSSAALSVPEDEYSDGLINREGVCSSCGDHGRCDLFGDTDEAIRFFPDPAPEPIVYTATHRYGPIKPVYFSELTLQVAQETDRQRGCYFRRASVERDGLSGLSHAPATGERAMVYEPGVAA